MNFRAENGNALGRAHSAEDKARVRQAFINAGRALLATDDPQPISLRRIASAAGYSPGTIYQYFKDHRELLFAIREFDMNEATDLIEAAGAGEADPKVRLRKLFLASVRYWLTHLDHFELLFFSQLQGTGMPLGEEAPFGRSVSVVRSRKLYYGAVDTFLKSLPRRPITTALAADLLIATSHGVIAFPRLTRSMEWSDIGEMAERAIDSLIESWVAASVKPPATAKTRRPFRAD